MNGVALADTRTAGGALAARVREVLAEVNGHATPRFMQVAVPVEETDALAWLRAQAGASGPKGFWADRTGGEAAAFFGATDIQAGTYPEMPHDVLAEHFAATAEDVRYYGGMRFDPEAAVDPAWEPMKTFRFVLPRIELRVGPGELGARLLCYLKLPHDKTRAEELFDLCERLTFARHSVLPALPRLVHRLDRPDREGWERMVDEALEAIRSGRLEKVVLARKAAFAFEEVLDPLALMARLRAATHHCFHFLFQTVEGLAFLGASPERLFHHEGRRVWSEAVAGTRPRGATQCADERLRRELLESGKERREHALVTQSVQGQLAALCTSLDEDAGLHVLRLSHGQHLCVRLRGILRPEVSAVEVLRALHPTPAVGGTPSPDARHAIRRWESFDRGWYAGPVGWIGPEAAELAVGIRSGFIHGRTLDLFSGAGIVQGSVPGREWKEIEQKIGNFLDIIRE